MQQATPRTPHNSAMAATTASLSAVVDTLRRQGTTSFRWLAFDDAPVPLRALTYAYRLACFTSRSPPPREVLSWPAQPEALTVTDAEAAFLRNATFDDAMEVLWSLARRWDAPLSREDFEEFAATLDAPRPNSSLEVLLAQFLFYGAADPDDCRVLPWCTDAVTSQHNVGTLTIPGITDRVYFRGKTTYRSKPWMWLPWDTRPVRRASSDPPPDSLMTSDFERVYSTGVRERWRGSALHGMGATPAVLFPDGERLYAYAGCMVAHGLPGKPLVLHPALAAPKTAAKGSPATPPDAVVLTAEPEAFGAAGDGTSATADTTLFAWVRTAPSPSGSNVAETQSFFSLTDSAADVRAATMPATVQHSTTVLEGQTLPVTEMAWCVADTHQELGVATDGGVSIVKNAPGAFRAYDQGLMPIMVTPPVHAVDKYYMGFAAGADGSTVQVQLAPAGGVFLTYAGSKAAPPIQQSLMAGADEATWRSCVIPTSAPPYFAVGLAHPHDGTVQLVEAHTGRQVVLAVPTVGGEYFASDSRFPRNTAHTVDLNGFVVRQFKADHGEWRALPNSPLLPVLASKYVRLTTGVLVSRRDFRRRRREDVGEDAAEAEVLQCVHVAVRQTASTCWMAAAFNMLLFSPRLRGFLLEQAARRWSAKIREALVPPFAACATRVSLKAQALWHIWHACCRPADAPQYPVPDCFASACGANVHDGGVDLVGYKFLTSTLGLDATVLRPVPEADLALAECALISVQMVGPGPSRGDFHLLAGGVCGVADTDTRFVYDSSDGKTLVVNWASLDALEAGLLQKQFALRGIFAVQVVLDPKYAAVTCETAAAAVAEAPQLQTAQGGRARRRKQRVAYGLKRQHHLQRLRRARSLSFLS